MLSVDSVVHALLDNHGIHRKHGEVTEQEGRRSAIALRHIHLVKFKLNRYQNKAKLDMIVFGL